MGRRCLAPVAAAVLVGCAWATVAFAWRTAEPLGRHLFQTRALFVNFEDRFSPNGWYSGELLQILDRPSIRSEVLTQLTRMRAMGVNEIVYELRSADPVLVPRLPPTCNVSPDTGIQWPQPKPLELANLALLFDLAQSKGMRVSLILNNAHMDEQGSTNAQLWLGSILRTVQAKPALDYVAFGGDAHLIDLDGDGRPETCGGLAEAPLWLGPNSYGARYVEWAIAYGRSLGFPAVKLTAEATLGYYGHVVQQPAGRDADGFHLWRPIFTLKAIFDRLGIPADQRTYALSAYAHRKCDRFVPASPPCVDASAFDWYAQTLQDTVSTVGSGPRLVMTEFGPGTFFYEDHSLTIPEYTEIEGLLMQRFPIEGLTFFQWSDPTGEFSQESVKVRGPSWTYTPQQRELANLYGFHLASIPNGSFESGKDGWVVRGQADIAPLDVATPWRGEHFLRLTGTIRTSPLRASGATTYTTFARLRGDGTLTVRFTTCKRRPAGAPKRFRSSSSEFAALPAIYVTPKRTCFVIIEISGSHLSVDDVQ